MRLEDRRSPHRHNNIAFICSRQSSTAFPTSSSPHRKNHVSTKQSKLSGKQQLEKSHCPSLLESTANQQGFTSAVTETRIALSIVITTTTTTNTNTNRSYRNNPGTYPNHPNVHDTPAATQQRRQHLDRKSVV